MRNLKKILALVLALVMSLSLMATAGASKFPDVDAENPYATAIDVLDGLKVFQGFEDGTFKPTDTLNRAQAAVLVYRIATGDVENKYLDNYTYMAQSKFTDLEGYNWAKGYINYCQNAGIVVGTTATTFDPGAKVTGYQLLVMLLRTLGYGKAGEFSDPKGWELQTAAIAERERILKNVTSGDFENPAQRQMVAEILFRGLLTPTVEYNYTVDGGYVKGQTLGMREFKLEEISGVVTGNEYADLNSGSTLPGGKTDLLVGEKEYRLNVTTDLTDIGESRYAYVQPDGKHNYTLVTSALYDTGSNVVAESGDKQSSVSKFASDEAGLSVTKNSEDYFYNFDPDGRIECYSDYRIKYVLKADAAGANGQINGDSLADIAKEINDKSFAAAKAAGKDSSWSAVAVDTDGTDAVYEADGTTVKTPATFGKIEVTLKPKTRISATDRSWMAYIFGSADKIADTSYERGEIYVGTQSTKDISDDPDYSYELFVEKFLTGTDVGYYFTATGNGTWLKIIDNNNDGVADYVFRTDYTLAETTGYNARNEFYTYSAPGKDHEDYDWTIDLSPDGDDVNYVGDYEPAVGDMVLAALIDGKWQIEPAPMETKTIKTVSYKDKTVTTTDDDVYDESDIHNWTGYPDDMLAMSNTVQYEIFFDHFGHVIAYREVQGQTQYALLSELYYTNQFNGKYIKNNTPIVEITMGEEDTVELLVSNSKDNVFDGEGRTYYNNKGVSFTDYLTRAINQLGVKDADGNALKRTAKWNAGTLNENDQFVYEYDPALYATSHKVTETNVAAYSLSEDGESVTINSVSSTKLDRRGNVLYYCNLDEDGTQIADPSKADKVTDDEFNARKAKYDAAGSSFTVVKQPVFATDYVKLDATKDIKKGAVRYDIDQLDASYNVYGLVDDATWDGNYVNATHNTEYYIVGVEEKTGNTTATVINGISYFTDYANVPAIDADDIKAVYAVARNTNADIGKRDYWVADVIVIETVDVVQPYDSVSLIYNNPSKTTDQVRELKALDSQTTDPSVTLTPKDKKDWPGQWTQADYGFYELYETEVNEPEIVAGSIEEIPTDAAVKKGITDYNAHGIYAATVTRDVRVQAEGDYVMVHKGDNDRPTTTDTTEFKLATGEVPVYAVWSADSTSKYPTWELVDDLVMDDIEAGDEIIYVTNKAGTVKYIVITNYGAARPGQPHGHIDDYDWADGWRQANWLNTEWVNVINEQNKAPATQAVNLHFMLGDGETVSVTYKDKVVAPKEGTTDEFVVDIPEKADRFTFEATLTNPIKAGYALDPNWIVMKADPIEGNTYEITVVYMGDQTQALNTLPAEGTDVVIATTAGWTAFMTEVAAVIADPTTATDAELTAIKANLNAADEAIVKKFTTAEQTAIDNAIDDIGDIGAPAESFGALTIKTNNLGVTAEGDKVVIQHRAGNQAATLNIKQGELDELTIAQLVSCLTTDADETVTFVSAKNLDGQDTPDTTFAKRASSIVVKVGTCADLLTITVSNNAEALAYHTVTWTGTASADVTITVKDPGTQKDIKAGDPVASGDKFLEGVVLAVALGNSVHSVAATTGDTHDGTWSSTAKTFTVGTKDGELTFTAKELYAITAVDGDGASVLDKITFTSGVTMDGSAKKVLQGGTLVFTVPVGYTYASATGATRKSGETATASGATVTLENATTTVAITLTAKETYTVTLKGVEADITGANVSFTNTFKDGSATKIYSGDDLIFTVADGYKATVKVQEADPDATWTGAVDVTPVDNTYTVPTGSINKNVWIKIEAQTDAEKAAAKVDEALAGKTLSAVSFTTNEQATAAAIGAAAKTQIEGWLTGTDVKVKTVTATAGSNDTNLPADVGTAKNVPIVAVLSVGTEEVTKNLTISAKFTNAIEDVKAAITKRFTVTADNDMTVLVDTVKAEIEACVPETGAVIKVTKISGAMSPDGSPFKDGYTAVVTYNYTVTVGEGSPVTVEDQSVMITLK